ncbi:FMN-dependent NADH-azoreductase [Salinicola rhizosphaerae]|uniref:FMN dependent NADH:quinone oxidoreductase n=1 Tax=Salinicola rhizosphaerae TaxID=1443141 RepID=A0ABQ3ED85_9GAMM|nr:NAD(P)H-dependent oxidoreductase [Salinicola rhizosphaerae]GHB34338.1 hypothetical protein GCM10009038_36820 [Salinicola rhizosphaerae]
MNTGTLWVSASPHGEDALGNRLVRALLDVSEAVTLRDLVAAPLAPLTPDYAAALTLRDVPSEKTEALSLSERLIGELESTRRLIVTTPMHNFGMPAALKLWVDYVLRIHRTFTSTPLGKVGLLEDRPTLVIVSSGGFHQTGESRQPNFLTPHLRAILATLGIHSVEFCYLEGLVTRRGAPDDMIAEALEAHPLMAWKSQPIAPWLG